MGITTVFLAPQEKVFQLMIHLSMWSKLLQTILFHFLSSWCLVNHAHKYSYFPLPYHGQQFINRGVFERPFSTFLMFLKSNWPPSGSELTRVVAQVSKCVLKHSATFLLSVILLSAHFISLTPSLNLVICNSSFKHSHFFLPLLPAPFNLSENSFSFDSFIRFLYQLLYET